MVTKGNIAATPNHSARTFTLRKYDESGNFTVKYRTVRMSAEEFNSCLNNTENDWKQFLKSDDYYPVR